MQIADTLSQQLAGAASNTLLPTENDLAAEFGVSRVTVRSALRVLEQAGAVTRIRGRGTIANPQKIVRNAIPMITVEEDFRRQGIAYDTRVLEFSRNQKPTEAVRAALKLSARASVGHVRLVRRVKGKIICFEDRYIAPHLARRLTPAILVERDILAHLALLSGSKPVFVEFETEICPAGQQAASALGITPSTLMVMNNFVHLVEGGRPMDAGSICYRIDHCKFRSFGRLALASRAEEPQAAPERSPAGGQPGTRRRSVWAVDEEAL
jgi:GntR family transcriptional regulator